MEIGTADGLPSKTDKVTLQTKLEDGSAVKLKSLQSI